MIPGAEVEIRIIGIQNGKVRLGIVAPREVEIHREEVYERIFKDEPVPA